MKGRRRLPKLTLEQLETWFEKARPAPPCEGVSMLNGFLTGLVAGPVFITPNDWMGEVIGIHEERAVMGTKAQAVIDTIVDHYNLIVTGASTPRDVPGVGGSREVQPSLAAFAKVERSGLQWR